MNKLLVLSGHEIESNLGSAGEAWPQTSFDINDVPDRLRLLAPYAAFWGTSDDDEREKLMKMTPHSLRKNIKRVMTHYDELLDEWLAGPESFAADPTDAYVAFSALRMEADGLSTSYLID